MLASVKDAVGSIVKKNEATGATNVWSYALKITISFAQHEQ